MEEADLAAPARQMYRRTAMRILPVAAALLLSSCASGPTVRTDFDPAANFQNYRTYSWIETDVPRGMNPLMFSRVRALIDRALAARGYTQAPQGDFAIAFAIGEKDRTEINDFGPFYGAPGWGGYGWGGWGGRWGGWGPPYGGIDVDYYTERSVIIDIYDGPSRRPVWHGVGANREYRDKIDYLKLNEAIAAALAKFPPQPSTAH